MKFIIKLFSISLLFCTVLYLFSGVAASGEIDKNKSLTYLIVGFDSSPANTDVLCVATYDGQANTVRALQIPRDTAIKYKNDTIKINAFYSRKISEGATHQSALNSLRDKISALIGVAIDGCVSINADGLIELVDFLDGVHIKESDLSPQLREKFTAKEGQISLSGKDALEFVRYRKDYLRADLERLDAQKVFIKALLLRIAERRDFIPLLKFVSDSDQITFDGNKIRLFSFITRYFLRFDDTDLQMATLPGVAVKWNKIWYYTVKRENAIALISGYFPHYRDSFDERRDFIYDFKS